MLKKSDFSQVENIMFTLFYWYEIRSVERRQAPRQNARFSLVLFKPAAGFFFDIFDFCPIAKLTTVVVRLYGFVGLMNIMFIRSTLP